MTKSTKHLIVEMSIGMLVYIAVLAVLAVIFQNTLAGWGFELSPVLVGLVCGFIADVMMLIHMAIIIERVASSKDEGYATKMVAAQAGLRRIVFIVALLVIGTRPQVDIVAMIIGSLGLQAGAMLQPLVHRTFFSNYETDHNELQEEAITEERRLEYGDDEPSGD